MRQLSQGNNDGDIVSKPHHGYIAPILGIDRHRIDCDGEGINSLVAFYGCPLDCKYCLNPGCHKRGSNWMSPQQLYDIIKIDDIYFRATKGGITFGGGEPFLYTHFISSFAKLCGNRWGINLETSLNVSLEAIKHCISHIKTLFVDLKCFNISKYISYTGKTNCKVLRNLQWLVENGYASSVIVRIPNIPQLTDEKDIEDAVMYCNSLGLDNIDQFDYVLPSDLQHERDKRINYGKEICSTLKKVRLKMAKDNGLNIAIPKCTYDGPCIGTCPRCDAELQNITTYLNILENNNVNIIL